MKTIDSSLSSLGIVSPFRKADDIIPRLGELHLHLKSHLSRNNSNVISVNEKRRSFQRRNAFVHHLKINPLVETVSSVDSSLLLEEKNEE